jgi:HEAT repeat protein
MSQAKLRAIVKDQKSKPQFHFLPWLLASVAILVCVLIAPQARVMFLEFDLANLGPGDAKRIPFALKHLESSKSSIRQAAVRGLGGIGPEARTAESAIVAALLDESWGVASDAAWALGQINAPTKPVIDSLIKALDHDHGEVRRYAAYSLSRYPGQAQSAIPKLKKLLHDEHMGFTAAKALGAMGPGARDAIGADGIESLTNQLRSESLGDRAEAALALSNLAPLPKTSIAELEKLVNDKEEVVRRSASKSLLRVRGSTVGLK